MTGDATSIPGVRLIQAPHFRDHRGAFLEAWRRDRALAQGLPEFVQDNVAHSRRGVLRGLHYQFPRSQGKLIWVTAGAIFDVAVDIRVGSPTFGHWGGHTLTADAGEQLYLPAGLAHGYLALTDDAIVMYKCTAYYARDDEGIVRWDDPAIAIAWPLERAGCREPLLSDRDRDAPVLAEIARDRLPPFA